VDLRLFKSCSHSRRLTTPNFFICLYCAHSTSSLHSHFHEPHPPRKHTPLTTTYTPTNPRSIPSHNNGIPWHTEYSHCQPDVRQAGVPPKPVDIDDAPAAQRRRVDDPAQERERSLALPRLGQDNATTEWYKDEFLKDGKSVALKDVCRGLDISQNTYNEFWDFSENLLRKGSIYTLNMASNDAV
jgi:hypothetical protein